MSDGATDVREFELELKLKDGSEKEYDYKRKRGSTSAKVKIRDTHGCMTKHIDQEAISSTEQLLSALAPTPDMSRQQLISQAYSALHLNPETVESLEVEVEFIDGTEIEAAA